VTDSATKPNATHPTHSWGLLAKDPWMEIGPPMDEETRQVLRRYWLRNGGDEALFERLVPPADAPKPKRGG